MFMRVFDIAFAVTACILLFPLFLVVVVLIKLDSRGPVFYRAWRMGKDFVPFLAWKFRSMTQDADKHGKMVAEPKDKRITRVGKYLRLFKIDELPQLFNVITGEMSVIGPRPQECAIVERYYHDEEYKVLSMKPGLTGLHQVTAFPDMTDEVPSGADPQEYYMSVQLHNRLAVELDYLEKRNFWLDLSIIVRTVYCVLIKSWLYLLFKKRIWIRQHKVLNANTETVSSRG